MLGPEQALQERVAMTGVALLVRPPLVAFQTLARGLVLVFKMPFIEALLLLLHLLGIVLLLAALDPLLVPLADARLAHDMRNCPSQEEDHQQEAQPAEHHRHNGRQFHAIAGFIPLPRTATTHDHLLMNTRRTTFLALCLAAVFTACKKEREVTVPLVNVDITVNLNLPEYNALQVVGGWAYLIGGSEGIVVYRKSMDEFSALDRHCTYQSAEQCKVTVDDSHVMARDTMCCQSAFLLMDGSVVQGPASIGLKQYHTTFNGTVLRIFN